jgi:hypothetical protein
LSEAQSQPAGQQPSPLAQVLTQAQDCAQSVSSRQLQPLGQQPSPLAQIEAQSEAMHW